MIFAVPRRAFTGSSPLFAAMFNLPSGEEGVRLEGKSDDNPIILEGYKAVDFDALLRVLYPSFSDLSSGGVTLTKDQWIGVLKLSTIWEMKEIRQFAIEKLSSQSPTLTPVERVTLARNHKVASWLIEGLTSLTVDYSLSPDSLEEAVGVRAAFRIASIRLELFPSAKTIVLNILGQNHMGLAIDSLTYECCLKPFMKDKSRPCASCSKDLTTDVVGSIYVNTNPTIWTSPNHCYLGVVPGDINCASCNRPFVTADPTCQHCNKVYPMTHGFTVIIGFHPSLVPSVERLVKDIFQDEIKEYDG